MVKYLLIDKRTFEILFFNHFKHKSQLLEKGVKEGIFLLINVIDKKCLTKALTWEYLEPLDILKLLNLVQKPANQRLVGELPVGLHFYSFQEERDEGEPSVGDHRHTIKRPKI